MKIFISGPLRNHKTDVNIFTNGQHNFNNKIMFILLRDNKITYSVLNHFCAQKNQFKNPC